MRATYYEIFINSWLPLGGIYSFFEIYLYPPYSSCMMMECILQVPAFSVDGSNFSLWGSGEWWMLLAAQSMAVGTVMIRWITKYSDPVMATGWVHQLVQL